MSGTMLDTENNLQYTEVPWPSGTYIPLIKTQFLKMANYYMDLEEKKKNFCDRK